MALLEVRDLTVRFGGLLALSEVSFDVEPGAIAGLIGPNGAGKTTVFNCITRIFAPSAGAIRFAGQDLLRLKPYQVVECGIARTFQNLELNRRLRVIDNVMLGAHSRIRTSLLAAGLRLPSSRRAEETALQRSREALALLGISNLQDEITGGLPYGTLKMVELARALAAQPRLLLLDEPAAGLTTAERGHLGEVIRRIRRELGITILMVEHDMQMVMSLCEHLVVLDFGRKLAEGSPEQVRSNPAVVEAYLGEADAVAAET